MVLSGAAIYVRGLHKANKEAELKIKMIQEAGKKIEQLRIDDQNKAEQEKTDLKKQVEQLNKDLQAKAEARKRSVVAQAIAPTAKAYGGSCAEWMRAAGVSDTANASELIRRESGCNPNALNRSSGACGIPQALPCSKLGTNDPVAQIRWMQNYVMSRYGSWANAVAFHNSHNWY